jgi:predicted enzyme related to lactoylglutathione lyase
MYKTILHFDIGAEDPEKIANFYKKVFDWEIEKWEGEFPYFVLITHKEDEPGINGGIGQRRGPESTMTNIINVPSVEEYQKKVENAGGKVISPKQTIPGVGYLAICQDPENITFGIMRSDMEAK